MTLTFLKESRPNPNDLVPRFVPFAVPVQPKVILREAVSVAMLIKMLLAIKCHIVT